MNTPNTNNIDKPTKKNGNNQPQQVPYSTFDVQPPMSKEELQQFKERHDEVDEGIFTELRGNARLIKEGAIGIKKELERQEPLLSNLDNDMDRIEAKMQRSNNILGKYLAKSSSSCLYWTIGIELVLVLLIFMI